MLAKFASCDSQSFGYIPRGQLFDGFVTADGCVATTQPLLDAWPRSAGRGRLIPATRMVLRHFGQDTLRCGRRLSLRPADD